MNARAKVCLHRQLKFVIGTVKVWEHRQPKFVNATAKVWHAATEAEKFHTFSLPRCRCYPEGLYLNSQQRFWLQFYWFIMPPALPGCHFHVVVSTFVEQEPSNKILTHSQSRSMNRKRTYIISRLLEVKGDSVEIFNFYMSMEHSWRWTGLHMQSERTWADHQGNTLLGTKCLRQCLAASRG